MDTTSNKYNLSLTGKRMLIFHTRFNFVIAKKKDAYTVVKIHTKRLAIEPSAVNRNLVVEIVNCMQQQQQK